MSLSGPFARKIGRAVFGGLLLGPPVGSADEPPNQGSAKSIAPNHYEQQVVQESFINLSDPSLTPAQAEYWAKAEGPGPVMAQAQGALFGVHGPTFLHVEQGIIPDCYVAASFAATAAVRPKILYQVLLADDGVYRARLWKRTEDEAGHPRWIQETYGPVDADFPVFPEGFDGPRKALYGAPSQTLAKQDAAHWWPLVEKAMAAGLEKDTNSFGVHFGGERGSYGDLGSGGDAGQILGMIFGAPGYRWGPLFAEVQQQLDAGLPVVASTSDVTPEARLRELGVGTPAGVHPG